LLFCVVPCRRIYSKSATPRFGFSAHESSNEKY
jgi:hypothetical protein